MNVCKSCALHACYKAFGKAYDLRNFLRRPINGVTVVVGHISKYFCQEITMLAISNANWGR